MMIRHRFVNEVIGVAAGFRDVALNHVYDSATFELIERNASDFPLATRDCRVGGNSHWHAVRSHSTRWHDESHWTFAGDMRHSRSETALAQLGTVAVAEKRETQVFPLDTQFREVVENMRAERIAAIQDHFDRHIALIDGEIWMRASEPCFCLQLDETDIRKVKGLFRKASAINPALSDHIAKFEDRGFKGQRFRLDDAAIFRESVLDHIDLGWTLDGSDGVVWAVPDVEVLVPESIALEPEAQTVVDIAYTFHELARPKMKHMSCAHLEASCLLLDAFERTRPASDLFDESQISELLDAVRSLAGRDFARSCISVQALKLVADRWENRAIGDFLPLRSHESAV
ncbi:hypothetical protein HFO56_24175 [Rhizobium laguerreae]|uniref:hypothetical protein n=1 Tax=Rhizobium laguerreae TaxID=1076926 RepID=UPI001C911591|nr:hypothetical protein [Rhizobium laguerreae]MBY3155427.1 hypothetical protein [Rhizobium laguerreae]